MPFTDNAVRRSAADICAGAIAAAFLLVAAGPAVADELPTFTIEMKDGTMTPNRFEVPADTAVKIVIKNTGTTPAEFESLRLHKEKVVAAGTQSFIVLRKLSPGEYAFFDDFHPDAGQAVIVAK